MRREDSDQEVGELDSDHPNTPVDENGEQHVEVEVEGDQQALQDFGGISDQLDALNLPQLPPPLPEGDEEPGVLENAAAHQPPAQLQPPDVEQAMRRENAIRDLPEIAQGSVWISLSQF